MIFIKECVLISVLIVLIQIADSYLRYLPFSKSISISEIHKLWFRLVFYGASCFFIYTLIFAKFGLITISYKLALALGWIPFAIITIKTIDISKIQHLFILGMSSIWNLIIHSVTSIIDIIFYADLPYFYIFALHAVIYLSIFIILLPIERKCFMNLLPNDNFFDNQPYGKYIVIFPFVIMSGVLILWIDNNLIHSWQERLSRIYLPLSFFMFYQYVLSANEQIYKNQQTIRHAKQLKAQLSMLEEHNQLIQKNQNNLAVLRHDMKHNYRLIFAMIQDGKLEEVLKHIKEQENLLDLTVVKQFCYAPLVNSAISIYLQRAEKFGIKVKHKINLPKKIKINESDLAILISNLLENAINASKIQALDRREISITIEHIENQYALEVRNLYDFEIKFDESGLPITNRKSHGIGMISLKNFVEKYQAQLDFSQKNGEVKVMIYWED